MERYRLNIGTLRVNLQVQRVRDGGVLVFYEPRNFSRHTIDLPHRPAEGLRSHRKRKAKERGLGATR